MIYIRPMSMEMDDRRIIVEESRMMTISPKEQCIVEGYLWAYINRPELVGIYRHTKKWRTQKKCMGRIKKEWRNYHEQR